MPHGMFGTLKGNNVLLLLSLTLYVKHVIVTLHQSSIHDVSGCK